MKTADVEGAQLDYWVARARGIKHSNIRIAPLVPESGGRAICQVLTGFDDDPGAYVFRPARPSSVWADGGPMIEVRRIDLSCAADGSWLAWCSDEVDFRCEGAGPTPLVAAMRALITSVFGETLPEQIT